MVNLSNFNSRATLAYMADPWGLSQLPFKGNGFSLRPLRRNSKQSFNTRSIRRTNFRQTKDYNPFNGYGQIDAQKTFERLLGHHLEDQSDLGGYQWNLDQVNAPEVWASGATGAGVTIAVIDSGIDLNHHEFRGRITAGIDFVDQDYVPQDLHGHGTHVAGTLAAAKDGTGITGIAHNARLMPIRVLDDAGAGSISDVISGIRWAADNGADVINLSLGGDVQYSRAMKDAISHASRLGSVVVMASGNSGRPSPAYPAIHATDQGIAVGAVNRYGQMANFSNRAGHQPLNYVTAPGVDIASSYLGNRYALASGTSMSTPHVAGVAALLKGRNKRLSPATIEHLISGTAKNSSFSSLKSDNITGRKRQNKSVITLKNLDKFSEDMLRDPLIGSLRGNYKQRQNTTSTISSQIDQQPGNFADIHSFKILDPIQNFFVSLDFSDTSTGDRKDQLRELLSSGFRYFELDQTISI